MMVYFYNDKKEGHIMTAAEPTGNDLAAINTPAFDLNVNAYIWAMDETVRRGLLTWKGRALVKAETYDRAAAFDPF